MLVRRDPKEPLVCVPRVLCTLPMRARRASLWGLLGCACAAQLAGCDSDPDGCTAVESAAVWAGPPDGPLCVLGDLTVEGRSAAELDVLARVEEVAGSLLVHDNPTLKQLPAWPALRRIGGSLSISANAELLAVGGFPALSELVEGLYVAENPKLMTVAIGDELQVVGAVFFALNPRLTEISGLSALERVERDVHFTDDAALAALELSTLAEVGGNLRVDENLALRAARFPSLRSVTGIWSVRHNPALESLAGFAALERVEQAYIEDNDALSEIVWTTEVPAVLDISDNDHLERVEGGPAVRLARTTRVTLARNPELRDIEGFAGVVALDKLAIEENTALVEVSGWSGLATVPGLGFAITRNPALTGPDGWFPALEAASDVAIFADLALEPAIVADLLAHVTVEGTPRVGDNKGESTSLDPCPWPGDGICDGTSGARGPGTGLCVLDLEDCE